MSKTFTTEKFIESASNKFNSLFDYSKVQYKNANTKITIICKIHGEFTTTPWRHLGSKHGCSKCGTDAMAKQQRDKSLEKLNNFINSGVTDYDYSLVEMNKITDKITVICKNHGPFSLTADHHIRGIGCKKCADQNKVGGYNEIWFNFDLTRKDLPGSLYVLEMYSDTEKFIKVGITKRSVEKRYQGCKYKYKVLELYYAPLYKCYLIETKLKQMFLQQKYQNALGLFKTESFKICAKDDIIKQLSVEKDM